MIRYSYCSITACLVLCTLPLSATQAETDSSEILEGLHVTPAEIARLENGEILAFSDEAYESTKRELAADAMVVVGSDLTVVLEALRESTTLIPTKVLLDHAEILTDWSWYRPMSRHYPYSRHHCWPVRLQGRQRRRRRPGPPRGKPGELTERISRCGSSFSRLQ